MKRDLLCISEIIRKIESKEYKGEEGCLDLKIKGFSKRTIDYHIQLLKDADFLKTRIGPEGRELPIRLTWKGHEYVDQSLRNSLGIIEKGVDIVEGLDL